MKLKHLAIATFFAAVSLAQGQANHLLITEIGIDVFTEGNTDNTEEYVEIFNPTGATIELDNYYLTDFKNYFQLTTLPSGVGAGTSDNLIRFPANTDLAPGQVAVICNKGSLFLTRYFTGFAEQLPDSRWRAVTV